MRIGAHMRISRGFDAAARLAAEIGCETIQVFDASPSAWRARVISPQEAETFCRIVLEHHLRPVFVHTQYLLNLASPDPEIHAKSTSALADAMHRARTLGAHYVVTHIGSHKGAGVEQGIERVCKAVCGAMDRADNKVALLFENSAGSGNTVGSRFEELREVLDRLPEWRSRLGICLDTAHLWSAGYDVSGKRAVARTIHEFDSLVGLPRLKLLHLNDTQVRLACRVDRHATIGAGKIGEPGFAALLHHPALRELAGIIETPATSIEDDVRDIGVLKRLRGT